MRVSFQNLRRHKHDSVRFSAMMTIVLVLPAAGVAHAQSKSTKDSTGLLSAIETAYFANRDSFSRGRFKFHHAIGRSNSPESAVRMEWKRRAVANCLYVFEGTNTRYECLFDLDALVSHRERTEQGGWNSVLSDIRAVSNGKLSLVDRMTPSEDGSSMLHEPQIELGSQGLFQQVMFPLAIRNPYPGAFRLGDDLKTARSESNTTHAEVRSTTEVLGDRRVVVVSISRGDMQRTYWVDVERGAIPLRIRDTDREGALKFHVEHSDLRLVDNKGWLPYRTVIFFDGGLTKSLELQEVDLNGPIGASDFTLAFPTAVPIINIADMVRYAPATEWNLSKLPSSGSPKASKIKLSQPQPPAPTLPGERTGPPPWVMPLIVVGSLVTLSAIVLFLKGAYRARSRA